PDPGKLEPQCGTVPRSDTNASADARFTDATMADTPRRITSSLHPATPGSAGLDLATSTTVTLLESSVHLLPTGIFGPPGPQKSALLIGRSSTSLSGLFVLPGVVDSDSVGEIKIMAWTPFSPCTVPQGTRLKQLIPFPYNPPPTLGEHKERVGGFGSTGTPQILWVQTISDKCHTCKFTLSLQGQQITLSGILDTGADVTVISHAKWPPTWALTEVPHALTGIGGSSCSCQSLHLIQVTGPEGHIASIKPFVLSVPMVLWGQDVLSQWGFKI
ncbi:POK9 protein, partial [Nicator chloris]|nr:POK9 protein [Nicator chloris]